MENTNKNTTILIGLLVLILGLLVGYLFGINNNPNRFLMNSMHNQNENHMYDEHNEDIISQDGAMQHAMDEMMLGFRGKTGADYEEMFLRGMIVHHIGAVEMAEQLLEQTDKPELINLANEIIESQSKEVQTMKVWLKDWFNK